MKLSLSGLFKATTDLYGNCTLRHSGTSAAAPEAAGVFALALEAKYVRRIRAPLTSLVIYISVNTIACEYEDVIGSPLPTEQWVHSAALYSELQFQAFAAYQCH